jgi:hypothetical protein
MRELLCGHAASFFSQQGHKGRCKFCGSYWDLDFADKKFNYAASYPTDRGHFDTAIGENKVKSLIRWLSLLNVDLSKLTMVEIGFGGGATLRYFHSKSKFAYGIETIPANISHAAELGVPSSQLFNFDQLPQNLPAAIDLWVFLDSFEHLPDPHTFLTWMSSARRSSRILMVLPQAGSWSDRLLGRLWPHKLPDHSFHWSKTGLSEFLLKFGFRLDKEFSPKKVVTINAVLAHAAHKFNWPPLARLSKVKLVSWLFPPIYWNIGEMGLLFSRD